MVSDSESQDRLNGRLWTAVELGETANVRPLLAAGADPHIWDSYVLFVAATHGYTEIVALLLEDGRADPAACQSRALTAAAEQGHAEIVRMLLADGRVDPAAEDSKALLFAVRGGHIGVVRALLEQGRADPVASDSAALRMAATCGNREIVRELLKDGRADPVAAGHDFGLARAARSGHVDSLCFVLAAMSVSARMRVVNELLVGRTQRELAYSATFLRACRHDPAMSRMLDIVQVLLKSDIPTRSLIPLAYEAERRNMNPEAVLDLQQRGEINKLLRNRLGPTAEMPPTAAVAQQADLTALAGVSKAEPMLHMGPGQLDLAQYPGILEALAPTLPAHVTTAIWQTLRAQARGEEPPRAYGTPAQRVRDRMASSVLLDAAVRGYNAFVGDVKNVANHKDPLLSAAANHCLRALNALSDAMTHADAAAIAGAQAQVETKMQTYEERVKKVLEEVDPKRARGFELVRSIVRMPAQQLAEFSRAQARERTSRKAPQIAL